MAAIQAAGGAMQAVMEFDPPLPKSALEEKYSRIRGREAAGVPARE